MKNEPKLKETNRSADEIIGAIQHAQKQADAWKLLEAFSSITGKRPKVWAAHQIGVGKVRYRTQSGREGDMYMTGFAINARRITLYLYLDSAVQQAHRKRLGKVKPARFASVQTSWHISIWKY